MRVSREGSKQKGAGSAKALQQPSLAKEEQHSPCDNHHREWSGCVLSSARHAWKARLSCAEGSGEGNSGKLKLGASGGKVS